MIQLKTPSEIAILRKNGAILASIIHEVCKEVAPGKRTIDLDQLAERLIEKAGARPAFKGYQGYPATLCTSINSEVVHGIPSDRRQLQEGDILSIDAGLLREGLHVDMAVTVPVGAVDEATQQLLRITERALWLGIEQVTIGNRLSDISHAIGSYVEREGFSVVKEYVGHGIGRDLHEDPQIPNFGPPGQGPRLRAGMVFAIEPMVKTDSEPTKLLDNDWTVVTATGRLAAHYEHTVALTQTGVDVLTQGGE